MPVAERPLSPVSRLCVRHLPRPTGLPPMAFAVSFRIRFADAKTAVKHHRPTHILPLEHHLICNLISRPKDSSQVVSIAKECILRLSPPDAFIEQENFVTCCMTSICFMVWMCLRLVTSSPRAFNLQFYASFCS